jgi:hypothetical protein
MATDTGFGGASLRLTVNAPGPSLTNVFVSAVSIIINVYAVIAVYSTVSL